MITICIVEDQTLIRNELVEVVNQSENLLLLKAFVSGEDALPYILENEPQVVIMDINLPGMNGIDCIKKVKEKGGKSQFIMFTIYENDDSIFDALQAGANGYILKKTPSEKIIESIIELHNGGSPMNFNIARKVISYFQKRENEYENLLTEKQKKILQLLSKGYLYKEIANELNIASGTVTQHIHSIYDKLHVTNKTEAINKVYGNRI